MPKYFAYIDDREQGPFTAEQLVEAGIRPSTYIWCKGMDDWTRADEVADVCRLFRRHIAGIMHPAPPPAAEQAPTPDTQEAEGPDLSEIPPSFRRAVEKSGTTPGPPLDLGEDPMQPPRVSLTLAILATLLCFPPTGLAAIFYTVKAQKAWKKACMPDAPDAESMRTRAHEYSRQSKMWSGITISLGMILYAFIFSRTQS